MNTSSKYRRGKYIGFGSHGTHLFRMGSSTSFAQKSCACPSTSIPSELGNIFMYFLQTRGEPDVDVTGCYELKEKGIWVRTQMREFSKASKSAVTSIKPPIHRVRRSKREAFHSPPSTAGVRNGWNCASTPHTP